MYVCKVCVYVLFYICMELRPVSFVINECVMLCYAMPIESISAVGQNLSGPSVTEGPDRSD